MDKISQDLERAAAATVPGRAGFDYLIVGAGFAGSVLAERLADAARTSACWSSTSGRTSAATPTTATTTHGVLIHPYGPHIFHTNSDDVFDYLSQFTEWRPYQHRVLASVDGQLVPMPINLDTDQQALRPEPHRVRGGGVLRVGGREDATQVRTSEDVVVSKVGRELYDKFFRGYTRKQWGLDPSELDASVTARVPTRTNRDDRYFTDTFQAMPLHGYTRMFERMLDHPNIKVMLNTDYREIVDVMPVEAHGLHRPDRRVLRLHATASCRTAACASSTRTLPQEQFQPVGTVNYPERLRLHAHHRVQAPHRPGASAARRSSTSTRAPRATRTTRCRGPRTRRCTSATRREAEADARRHLRRPAGAPTVLQHGPGGRPGADRLQAAAATARRPRPRRDRAALTALAAP